MSVSRTRKAATRKRRAAADPAAGAGTTRRSQKTRDRILEAAKRLFGELGYDRTTIRAVAAEADIHPSMVMRYYESKEGLFAATSTFDLEIPDLSLVPPGEAGRTLVRHFLQRWKARSEELPALLRAAVTHDQARTRLLSLFRQHVAPAVAKVSGPEQAEVCAALVVTQMIGLAVTRQVLRVPAVVDLPEEIIIDRVGKTIEDYMTGPNPPSAGKKAKRRKPTAAGAYRESE